MNSMKTISYFSPRSLAALVLCAISMPIFSSAHADEVILQDDKVLAAFDSDSGALTRLENKATHWKVEQNPKFATSFHLNALLENGKNNTVTGQKQHAIEVKKLSENQVSLKWKDLASDHGETLPMTLT